MNIRYALTRIVAHLIMERPVRNKSYADLAARMEASGREIDRRLSRSTDTPKNRTQIRHVIGIERWGQRRLRVGLGEPPTSEEYDGYQPAANLPWDQLRTAFQDTRRETVALIRELERTGVAPTTAISHNQIGELSVRGWLSYLDTHASFESRRIS